MGRQTIPKQARYFYSADGQVFDLGKGEDDAARANSLAQQALDVASSKAAIADSSSSSNSDTWSINRIKQEIHNSGVNVASITLAAADWIGSGPYTQSVTITGATITANTKVDVQPDSAAIAAFIASRSSALYIENNSGSLTAYIFGDAPSSDITVQCTYYETI